MNEMYYEFSKNVKERLSEEINGRIVYEAYPAIDTIIFKVSFKDFDFAYPIANVQEVLYTGGSTESIVEDFKSSYLKTIKKTFFKSEQRKKRDEMAKMGICEAK